jgi:hypothetical protein
MILHITLFTNLTVLPLRERRVVEQTRVPEGVEHAATMAKNRTTTGRKCKARDKPEANSGRKSKSKSKSNDEDEDEDDDDDGMGEEERQKRDLARTCGDT